ncbi:ECF subfamily RNA polymerase sigma-24 subunit [Nitritalea halalkaliphila LW7]|uniref:ECF subfamily RNA polymerase sigma-24 subunit n=1 Tax=Nitritalea halalkaliphila LW7 TaxID=1189621 RepID=I5C9B1_9BACT|nr:RNA polymerase sigma factor [Nitritalea halalkaliphila]EIM78413.1 ECF subfamily RNA polymerase sigma-24 subunit [Nitritalea halalkaliphila LW7]
MEEKEFLQHIQAHQGTIYHLLRLYVSDADDQDDIKQEIVLQAWKSKDSFRKQSSFNTWLYKLALYTILTAKRKVAKMQQVDLQEADGLATDERDEQEEVQLLYRSIYSLDDLSKTIITMHLDGFTNAEIATFIGITPNHLGVKLHRIKETISSKLKASSYGAK